MQAAAHGKPRLTVAQRSGKNLDLWQFANCPVAIDISQAMTGGANSDAASNRIEGADGVSGISDRKQEIKRRRHRRKKLLKLSGRLKKATFSEKQVIAAKIRNLTPGAEVIIANWGLQEQDR
jgi:hypothetical protein